MRFGEMVRKLRLNNGLSLREFCLKHGHDASNMSKIERSRLAPPQKPAQLTRLATELGLTNGSAQWQEFMDLAASESGRIPKDMLEDEQVLAKLPILFRAARGQKVSPQEMKKLVQRIREA